MTNGARLHEDSPAHDAVVDEQETAPGGVPATPTRRGWAGRVFTVAAVVEAITWTGLLIGMYLKYVPATTEVGVQVFGRLHGGAFLAYLVVVLVTGILLRWRWWLFPLALLAAVPPLATIPLEIWLHRSGRLAPRAHRVRRADR